MSQSRGRQNRFVDGHEAACRAYINSKQCSKMLIVCFAQRRLNTSYSKRLFWSSHSRPLGCGWVTAQEKWEWHTRVIDYNPNVRKWASSTIELVHTPRRSGAEPVVVGRSYSDGRVWLDDRVLASLPRKAHRREMIAYLDMMYTSSAIENGYMYYPIEMPIINRRVTQVTTDDTWTNIMNRENAV